VDFPVLAGVPCLLRDPAKSILAWRAGLADLREVVTLGRDRLLADVTAASGRASTRARLERLRDGLGRQLEEIERIFADAGIEPRARAAGAERPRLGDGILSYFHHIHRDWGWPEAETDAVLSTIASVLPPDRPLGDTLVLGAGAARLVRELHARHGGTTTVALDINPLPFFVARNALDGRTITLTEIPTSPRSVDDVAVTRRLGEGLAPVDGIHLVFGDALAPPVRRGSFDTVVTPWFLDQVAPDVAELAPLVRSLLAPAGAWLNHGPLVYPSGRPTAARYTADEVLEIVAGAGFRVEGFDVRRLSFMESPACNQGRTERILTFMAARSEDAPAEAQAPAPAWIEDTTLPVPRLEALRGFAPPHPFFAAVVGMVDGERSIDDIAATLAQAQNIPLDALRVAVRACLADLARRGS
jgi:hypothetical protein